MLILKGESYFDNFKNLKVHMFKIGALMFFCFYRMSLSAQSGGEIDSHPKQSFEDEISRSNPGDGRADSVYFISNGAVHIYYHLKLVLSSTNAVHEFKFIKVDLPLLESVSYLEENEGEVALYPHFIVGDLNADGSCDIYICLDTVRNPIPEKFRKMGITSNRLLISSDGSNLFVKNFRWFSGI